MKNKLLLFIVLTIASSFMIGGCKNQKMKVKQYSVEDFFKKPEKTSYQISPDGKYYSYKAPYQDRMNIFVQEIGKDNVIQLTKEIDRDIAAYFWANNNKILFLKDDGGDENYKLHGVNIDGSNPISYTNFDKVRTQIIDDLEDIPSEIIIGLNKRNPQVFDPYRLNIETGKMTLLAKNPGNILGWMTDHAGKLRVAYSIVGGVNTSILYRKTENDEFKNILTTNFKESLSPLFFTFDNKNVYASSNLGRDKSAIIIYDIENGKEIKTIFENHDYDVSSLSYSKNRKTITAASYTSWKRQRHFFDKETKNMFNNLKKKLGEYEIAITSHNKKEDKFIVRTYSDRSLGSYYLYTKETDNLDKICDVSPWLNENDLSEMKPIEYKSRDGLTIHGYLTLPKGKKAKNLPIIINPHGGPWARDAWTYNPEIQLLANRGYAVFQMNFRGSTGYGKDFWTSSFKQWGLKMQDDITDGVNWLINKGIADKSKIAIYGGSYGGYAVLAGVTLTPDLYCCAIDYVGVSNLFSFMKTIPPYWKPLMEMNYEMVGHPVKDSIQLAATSPALHADKVKTPLFIAQGANDPRVNKDESDQMVKALKDNNIEVEYMVKDNEGHGFHNQENQFEFYNAMLNFLDKHMK